MPLVPRHFPLYLYVVLLLLLLAGCRQQPSLRVVIRETTPLLNHAAGELASRLGQSGYKVEIATGPEASAAEVNAIILSRDASAPGLQPEGFRIVPLRASGFSLLRVIGYDPQGVLRGSQELAEQIVSSGQLEAVREQVANPHFLLRAIRLPLPLPEASPSPQANPEAQDRWRPLFDLLSRSRFNAIFFQMDVPLPRIAGVSGEYAISVVAPQAVKSNADWLRAIFRMARDRGLDPYLWLTRASLEGLLRPAPSAPASSELAPAPASAADPLADALPAAMGSYPELAGLALDADLMAMSEPQGRSRWVAEKFLAPLAQAKEWRPVFLSVDPDWWPSQGEWDQLAPGSSVCVLAPVPLLAAPQRSGDVPVLWRLDPPPSELLPWEDPGAARETLRHIRAKKSLGFLEESLGRPPERAKDLAAAAPPSFDEGWFRLLLWGRLGYSADLPDQYWEQQFAGPFGIRAGPFIYAAAAHSSKILSLLRAQDANLLPSPRATVPPDGIPAAAQEFLFLQSYLLEPASGRASSNFLTEALREKGLWLAAPNQPSNSLSAEAIEQETRLALQAADEAARYGAWRGAAHEEFHRRILSVAGTGSALAENQRAARASARFLLDAAEEERRAALDHLQKAQQAIAAATNQTSPEGSRLLARLEPVLARAVELVPKLQPWQWEKRNWEAGAVEGWQPASFTDMPTPPQWYPTETARLEEFGPYGGQPVLAGLNQQLRSAFLPPPREVSLTAATWLVGRTRVAVKAEGRLVMRVLSDQAVTIWVNRRRALPLSPQQFPWFAASPPAPPLRAQLFLQTDPARDTEVVVAAVAAKTSWPLISFQSLWTPAAPLSVTRAARQATQLEGGVVFVPGTESFPQPHLALSEAPAETAPQAPQPSAASRALFPFSVSAPGFYRFRLWLYWQGPRSPGLNLSLDGSVFQQAAGRADPVLQTWHWLPVDAVAGLGAAEHTLAVTGWKPGARLGSVEVSFSQTRDRETPPAR